MKKRVCILCDDTRCRVGHALNRRDDKKVVCGCIYYPYYDTKYGEI